MKSGVVLVLGGARSGKSTFAETLVVESGLSPVYVATAEPRDAEMAARIAAHRARRGSAWRIFEEPDAIETILAREAAPDGAILVDCLTLWLANLMEAGADIAARTESLGAAVTGLPGLVVLVSNEIGLGLVPETALGRDFRDAQGRLNQSIAAVADRVILVAAGLPLILKGPP